MPTNKATSGKATKKLEKRAKKREQKRCNTAPQQQEVAAPAATPAASDGSANAPSTQQHDVSDRVNSACKRLHAFTQKTAKVMAREFESWVESEFSGDLAAAVVASPGDTSAALPGAATKNA